MPDAAPSLRLTVNGAALEADLSGAVYCPATRTVVVADLHLAKGSSFADRGAHLPPYDTRATLARLAGVLKRLRPARVVALGDSFHDAAAPARIAPEDAATLRAMTAAQDWLWVVGNHDPAPPDRFGGRTAREVATARHLFRHEADPAAAPGEISGHFHPCASVTLRGRRLSGRCFVTDGARLILPAFGAYAGGLDVRDPAIAGLFPGGFRVLLLGGRRPYPLTDRQIGAAA